MVHGIKGTHLFFDANSTPGLILGDWSRRPPLQRNTRFNETGDISKRNDSGRVTGDSDQRQAPDSPLRHVMQGGGNGIFLR